MHVSSKSLLQSCLIAAALLCMPSAAAAERPCVAKAKTIKGPATTGCAKAMNAETARGVGMGTGGRATAMSTSALAYNPAALSIGRLYHVEGNVDYIYGDTTALGASVVDSSTSSVGAGVSFRGFLSGDNGLKGYDGKLGLAFGFSDQISLGLGGRLLELYTEVPSADMMGTDEVELAKGFTMDASFRLMPTKGLHLAVLSYNFIDLESQYVPVMAGGSVGLEFAPGMMANVDVLTDVSTYEDPQILTGGGIEVMIANKAPVRAGYSFDAARELHTASIGLGYTDRRVGVDFAVAREVSGGDDMRISAGLRYYVH